MITISDDIPRLAPSLRIRKVGWSAPFHWLMLGAADLRTCGLASISHGLGMVVLGWLLLMVLGSHPYFVAAAVTGFLLVAPVMATGLCELSRRLEQGESVSFDDSLEPLARERLALFELGAALAVIAVVWFLASEVLLESVLSTPGPGVVSTIYTGFVEYVTGTILVEYVVVGLVLALLVFSITAISVPAIIDRHFTAGGAIRASLQAVRRNPGPMLLWGGLIAVFTAIGFVTLLAGMIVAIPWLGHSSWRAYRDLTGR